MTSRTVYIGIAGFCFGLVGFALYLQHTQGLEPCPLCILQRLAFIVAGAVALIGTLSGAAADSRWLPAVLGLPLLAGVSAAGRHVWLEHFPAKSTSCSPSDLGYILDTVPLADILPRIFRGSGDCGTVLWRFLGLSIAEWSLLCLLLLLVLAASLQVRALGTGRPWR
jgi:protein dithiol:quinone oxidoreductase